MTNVLPHIATVIKPCPPLTKKNSKVWEPLFALGCSTGFLYIFNLNKNLLVKKTLLFTTHSVNGIEWVSMKSLIAWSFHSFVSTNNLSMQDTASNNSGLKQQHNIKNELIYTDLRTGKIH